MRRVLDQIGQVAGSRAPLLVEGEPGSGRRRISQEIHRSGPRASEAFTDVRCTEPGEVVEERLFGSEGTFQSAAGGTLYLDEVAELPAAGQARLLLALHDQAFGPAGGRRHADVRVIASTARDLAEEVVRGAFRRDLFERLSVVRIAVPPLRDRAEDLEPLVIDLLREQRDDGRRAHAISAGVLERLQAYPWPGNVAELREVLAGMTSGRGRRRVLTVSDLPERLRVGEAAVARRVDVTVGMTVAEVERRLIAATLEHAGGEKPRAAALLGIGLRTLYRKIREYGLG